MLTIQELASRYSISRQQIYERIKAVGVNPIKRGNRSLFDEAMVATLDEQHLKLQQGFSLRNTTDDDHLTTQRQLQEIADQEWVLTTRMLAKVLAEQFLSACLGLSNEAPGVLY